MWRWWRVKKLIKFFICFYFVSQCDRQLTHKQIITIHFYFSFIENKFQFSRSPLGFSELFNEFRLQENLHSLDDILNAIINSEGMSFNDLKPIYKEFLLKLAVTLTKDELYQRSKSIMRRQKKKLMRRNKAYQVNIINKIKSININTPQKVSIENSHH